MRTEDNHRPETLLQVRVQPRHKSFISDTVAAVEEKRPFQPPLFAHSRHRQTLLSAVLPV